MHAIDLQRHALRTDDRRHLRGAIRDRVAAPQPGHSKAGRHDRNRNHHGDTTSTSQDSSNEHAKYVNARANSVSLRGSLYPARVIPDPQ